MEPSNKPSYSASVDALMPSRHVRSNIKMTYVPAVSDDMDNVQNVGGDAGDQIPGYIFMCNARTKPDCFIYRVFGLPASRVEVVKKIKPRMKLFLFDFDLRFLYGLYVADSSGKLAIEPSAFEGQFPAQVKFSIVRDCLPLPEAAFKDAIKENYSSGSKFNQELSAEQVNKLVALFHPIRIPSPPPSARLLHDALESLPPEYGGSSVQIAKPPSHRLHVSGSGLTNTQLYPSLSHVQEAPLRPLQVLSMRNDKLVPQFDPALSHQAYHPEDPGLHPHDALAGNAYMRSMVPPTISANSYYGIDEVPMPQSNASFLQSKAMTPSSLTASQWVAVASEAQTPGGQISTVMIPSSSERNAPYGSNVVVVAHQYVNQGYHSSYQEQPVVSHQGHSFQPNSASSSTYYRQSHGNRALPPTLVSNSGEVGVHQVYMYNGTNSSVLASGYQYQGYPSYYHIPAQTTDQLVNNVPAHVPETHSTYWNTAPASGHSNEQCPISQSTVPGVSVYPISGYVPTYSSGANPTY